MKTGHISICFLDYHHKIIKETCGNVASFHVSAYFAVHRPYFRMFPLDINISFRPVIEIHLPRLRSTGSLLPPVDSLKMVG